MTDEKQAPTADPIKQRAAEIVIAHLGPMFTRTELGAVERALREGMEMNERDAARYRWLRDETTVYSRIRIADEDGCIYFSGGADDAIDAAMLARNGE